MRPPTRDDTPCDRMILIQTRQYQRAFVALAPPVQQIVTNKLRLLATNPVHPSLQAHRLRSTTDQWACYITHRVRLRYRRQRRRCWLLDVGSHRIIDRIS